MSEYDELMQDLQDAPERKFPPKPEVWALVEVEAGEGEGATKWGKSKYPPIVDELTLRCKIVESAGVPDDNKFDTPGREAKGVEYVRLMKPSKTDAGFTHPPGTKDKAGNDISGKPTPRYGFMIGNYTSAMAALLAPDVQNNKKNADKVARAITDALDAVGGDRVKAVLGKRMLIKLQINDGCQGKSGDPTIPGSTCEYHGKPVIEKAKGRVEKPKNEVNSFMAATEANIASYVRGRKATGGAGKGGGW